MAERETLEASSQTEGVLETQKALLEASQQVVELESRLGKQSEEYLAMEIYKHAALPEVIAKSCPP